MGDIQADPLPGLDSAATSTQFPNTRLRSAADGVPSHSRAPPADSVPTADPDTCRICRGEGTPEEPLFYPCKCSGSIKYVHQDCLMEWLSHSQKKHCELCKTPFRFTKLYAPDMPKALPFHIFITHMAKYSFRNMLVWLRAALVVSVWLGWLPFLMRSVWSFLFWISDEGLGEGAALFGRHGSITSIAATATDAALSANYASSVYPAVCPASPLFAATTTVDTVGGVMDGLQMSSMRLVNTLYKMNLTAHESVYWTIARFLFGSVNLNDKSTHPAADVTALVVEPSTPVSKGYPSLLSDVRFLRNLTRHPSINRTVISILEGQIITILVIVCFILIILVRDYVVQQQPDLMRAGFAPLDNDIPPNGADNPPIQGFEEPEHEPEQEPEPEPEPDPEPELELELEPELEQTEVDPWPRLQERWDMDDDSAEEDLSPPLEPKSRPEYMLPSYPDLHPGMRERAAPVHEYLAIYRQARGDPATILKIAKDLKMEEQLEYWIRLSMDTNVRAYRTGFYESLSESSKAAQAGSSTEQANATDNNLGRDDGASLSLGNGGDKGKGRAQGDADAREDFSVLVGSPQRPRANTDGPKINDGPNPLANNSWSFAGLSDDRLDSSTPSSPSTLSFGDGEFSQAARQTETSPQDGERDQATNPSVQQPLNHTTAAEAAPVAHGAEPQRPNRQPAGLFNRIADFMWRDVDAIDPAELAAVDILDDFDDDDDVFGGGDQDNARADNMEQDGEAVEAAGLDPEAIEDAEDLEGILELLGMRGPIAGLFQNAIFCAFLVSITIFIGIFVPYNIGRITVWAIANPVRLARMIFSLSKFIQDCLVVMFGSATAFSSFVTYLVGWLLNLRFVTSYFGAIASHSWAVTVGATNRIGSSFRTDIPISPSEMRNFSAISHEALLSVKGHFVLGVSTLGKLLMFVFGGNYAQKGPGAINAVSSIAMAAWEGLKQLPEVIAHPSSWVINLNVPESSVTINPELAYWDGNDRFWAILSGFLALTLMAGLYLRRGTPFSTSQTAQEWEAALIDGLVQASGVMKVILIIGIEMLVFPLYCGMLLDIALLPLFEDASVKTRLLFTAANPVTSVFVHWFVGTGYMFHFALFVSMCRKIMRKGVLYFIRDPDDPEFHPVRDVLERSVTTQLRKILFSAFVYGALVIVCLGGVVWSLALALPSVLPIHYSSNEPVLEFPIDLLFYNFLMPLAVRFFRPSDGLHMMYTWWFRKCARILRITWFLFGERRVDEEGHLSLQENSPHRNAPWWKTMFLELDSNNEVVPKTWADSFEGGDAKPATTIKPEEMFAMNAKKMVLVRSGQLRPDGRFVRTPASDQVKIPKSQRVFLDVDERNARPDGRDDDIYATNQYQFVYIPPNFRMRIFLFILYIWLFAAATGVGITIVPLVFGRRLFKLLLPGQIRTNDIYAFSIGVYALSTVAYTLYHVRTIAYSISQTLVSTHNRHAIRRASAGVARVAKLVYAYAMLFVVFPLMFASLMELYAILPLHEFLYSNVFAGGKEGTTAPAEPGPQLNPPHTIRVIQGWTMGLLYLKLSSRIIVTWFDNTRPAAAVRAVLRRGWLDPDVAVLTRAFVVPGVALWTTAVTAPLLLAELLVSQGAVEALVETSGAILSEAHRQQLYDAYLIFIHRASFPLMAFNVFVLSTLWSMFGIFRSWKVRIRDEAYLIGERLHNFGVANVPPKARGAWRPGTRI
ncbi:hypothetical protein OQA88_996 [Cercophora sp. LCS_1]